MLWFMICSKAILHRCIPARGKVLDAYESINSWSVAQQLFSDLYKTWPTVLIMCFAAFGKFLLQSANSKVFGVKTRIVWIFNNKIYPVFRISSSIVCYDWINGRDNECDFMGHLYICDHFKYCRNGCALDHLFRCSEDRRWQFRVLTPRGIFAQRNGTLCDSYHSHRDYGNWLPWIL